MKIAIVAFALGLSGFVLSFVPCVGALAILWFLPSLVLGITGLICSFRRKVVGIGLTVLIIAVSRIPVFEGQDWFIYLIIFMLMLTIVLIPIVGANVVLKGENDPKPKILLKILLCSFAIILSLKGSSIAHEQFEVTDNAMKVLDSMDIKGEEREMKPSGKGTKGKEGAMGTIDKGEEVR